MRVSLRLLAEGSGRAPDLEHYLQEPLLLFLPLRTLLGLIEGFVVLLLALMIGISSPGSFLLLAGSMVAFGADLRISAAVSDRLERSRARARAAAAELPHPRPAARTRSPAGLLHLLNHSRKERTAPVSVNRDEVNDDGEVINGTSDERGRRVERPGRAQAPEVDRRLRRHARSRSDDAAPGHRRDSRRRRRSTVCARCSASRSIRAFPSSATTSTTSWASCTSRI